MNQRKGVAFVGAMTAITALLVTFAANKGINVQTGTSQDQEYEYAGETSEITNACTATSTPGLTQTTVTLTLNTCSVQVSFSGGVVRLAAVW